jgi:hypothetical protein
MKKNYFRPVLLLCFLWHAITMSGQVNVRDSSITTPVFYGSYGFFMLGGDIASQYGPSSNIGAGLGVKTKQNLYFGIEYNYLFGGKVKNGDEIFKNILTHDGQLIGQNGEYAVFQYFERGHMLWAHAGKLFPVLGPNPNSGIMFRLGAGYIQHRLVVNVLDNTALQLQGDYKKGYDRLTSGFGLNQFLGYMYMGDTRIWNFYGGIEVSQAWTQNRRDVNFDTGLKDDSKYFDLFFGIRIGWVIPMYRRAPSAYYIN